MFFCFSNPSWHDFFEAELAQFFLPLIAAMFILNLYVEYYRFYKKNKKELEDFLRIILLTLSTLSIVLAISLKVAGVHFILGPHLFLLGIGLGIITNLAVLISHLLRLRKEEKNTDEYNHHLQGILKQVNGILTKGLIFATILSVFVLPAAPAALITAFAIAAALTTVVNLIWNILTMDTKRNLKSHLGLGKSYYSRNRFF